MRDALLSEGLESTCTKNSLTNSFIDRLKLAVLIEFLIKKLFLISFIVIGQLFLLANKYE